jgi:hypothetical protein
VIKIVAIIAVLVLAGFGAYYLIQGKASPSTFYPQPSPSASTLPFKLVSPSPIASSSADLTDWRTYTNPTLGASFQYPPTWKIDPEKPGAPFNWIVMLSDQDFLQGQSCRGDCPFFAVSVSVRDFNNQPIDYFINQDLGISTDNKLPDYIKKETITLPNGITATKVTEMPLSYGYFYFVKNNKLYSIKSMVAPFAPGNPNLDPQTVKDLKYLDQLIYSFKFIN